jgi:ABC-type transport system involved in cytochrome bd biosynthesis fused ATPase/permease subunit
MFTSLIVHAVFCLSAFRVRQDLRIVAPRFDRSCSSAQRLGTRLRIDMKLMLYVNTVTRASSRASMASVMERQIDALSEHRSLVVGRLVSSALRAARDDHCR